MGMLRLLYSGHYLTRPVGRDRLVESLRAYMAAALATSAAGDMFGEQVGPAAILAAISERTGGQPVPQRQQTNDTSTDSQQAPAPQAAENPLAAMLMGSVLMQQGQKHGDKSQTEQGEQLLEIAQNAQAKKPTPTAAP
ncbi:hypothetical protein GY14_13515 [Delftia tsuruhatensis]|nr:hypothetical protein GY14_13515 [Delftia tsuruhatensis]